MESAVFLFSSYVAIDYLPAAGFNSRYLGPIDLPVNRSASS